MKLDIQLFGYYDGDVEIKVVADTKDFEKGLDRMQDSSKKAGSTIKNIVAGLGITSLIKKGFDVITSSIDDATKRFDTLNNFPKVMSNLGIATKDAQKQIDRMSTELAGLPTTLDQGALAVQRFTSKNGDVKKSTDIFLALNNAILAGGASSEIQASALEQLSQSYSKGKMDMMEWRTIQMAMPAQLKQVATAMGVTTDQLGVMLREGDNTAESMDNFMNTIIKLNKEGSNGFASFEKQARNSTSGIRTAITVAKTQVVKGVADMIAGMNKSLKKSNLPSLSELIAKVGKEAKKQLDNVAKGLSKVDLSKVISTIKTLIPIVASLTAGMIAYNTAVKLGSTVNFIKDLIKATASVLGLIPALNSATASQQALNLAQSMSPIGLLVGTVAALAAGLVYLSSKTVETDKELEKSNEKLKEYKNTMKQLEKQKDETLSKGMNEIYYYQSLSDELKGIVDENGKVQDGYEERASFIVGELNKAFDTEIEMTDGIITNYQNIQKEIDITLEKKKAMAYFNAHEEEYNEALKEEDTLQKDITDSTKKRDTALKNMNNTIDKEAKKYPELKKNREEILKYLKGEIEFEEMSQKAKDAYLGTSSKIIQSLKKESEAYQNNSKTLKESEKQYAENQIKIKQWRTAQEELAAGEKALAEGHKEEAQAHFEAIRQIFNDTITFNGKTKAENDKKYEEGKAGWEEYLKFLKANQDIYCEEFIKSEEERRDKELEILKDERDKANEQLKQKNKEALNTTITGLNDQLKTIDGKKFEFRDAGNGLVQMFADGEAKGQPMTTQQAQQLVNTAVQETRSKYWDMEQAGEYLSSGFASGIGALAWQVKNAAANIALMASGELKDKLGIASPSKVAKKFGKFFVEGFSIGIEENTDETINAVRNYTQDILDELNSSNLYDSMQRAVDLETGKISANVELGTASKNLSQMISANASFDGTINVEANLDGEKIWTNQQKITERKNLQYGGIR